MNTEKKLWLVSNGKDKAILINAIDSDEARKLANYNYYNPFRNEKDLNCTQVYSENNINHLENKIFKKVQFHSMGGVTTTYEGTIKTKPTERQIEFLGKPIEYVKFTDEI
jgi:hypothetical protein